MIETLIRLVDQNGNSFASFVVPDVFVQGTVPRTVQFKALIFAYDRPLLRQITRDRDAHQYRHSVPLNVTHARRLKLLSDTMEDVSA